MPKPPLADEVQAAITEGLTLKAAVEAEAAATAEALAVAWEASVTASADAAASYYTEKLLPTIVEQTAQGSTSFILGISRDVPDALLEATIRLVQTKGLTGTCKTTQVPGEARTLQYVYEVSWPA